MRRRWPWSGVSLRHLWISVYLEWYLATTTRLWTMQTRKPRLIRLSISTLILDAEGNFSPFMIRRRTRSTVYVAIFNQCPRNPLIILLAKRKQFRTFEVTPCDTPMIPDISLWECPWPEKRTMVLIITGRVLIAMISTLVWHTNLQTAKAQCWMRSM